MRDIDLELRLDCEKRLKTLYPRANYGNGYGCLKARYMQLEEDYVTASKSGLHLADILAKEKQDHVGKISRLDQEIWSLRERVKQLEQKAKACASPLLRFLQILGGGARIN